MKVADLFARLGLEVDDKAFKNADKLIDRTGAALTKLVAWGAAAAAAVTGLTIAVANNADEIGATAEKIGVNAQRYQELGFAAEQSDTSIAAMTQGLAILSRTMYDAQNGSKEAADAFKALGLDPKQFKTADEAFLAIAEQISKLPGESKKTALAMKLLGKSGKELVPLLNIGKDGIKKFADEAQRLGLVIDDAGLQAGSDFGDAMNRVKRAIGGLLNSAILPLLPHLVKTIDAFKEWILANRGLVASKLATWVKSVVSVLRTLGNVAAWCAQNFGVVLAAAVGVTAAKAFVTLSAAMTAAGVAGVKGALSVGAAMLASMAPVILIGAAVFLLILIFQDLWTAITGGKSVIVDELWPAFKGFLEFAWNGIKSFASDFAAFWKGIIDSIIASIAAIPQKLKTAVSDYFSGNDNTINTSTATRSGQAISPMADFMPGARQLPAAMLAEQAGDTTATTTTNTLAPTINITGSANPEETAKAARREIETWWGRTMRGAI